MKKSFTNRIKLYQIIVNYKSYIGVAEELSETLGVTVNTIRKTGRLIGYRYAEIETNNFKTLGTFTGTLKEVADYLGYSEIYIRRFLTRGLESKIFEVYFTGGYIYEYIIIPVVIKTKEKEIKKTPVTPMSQYWAEIHRLQFRKWRVS